MHSFTTFFSQQIRRHLRHQAIWIIVIIVLLGARFFIPLPKDGYVTMSINNGYPMPSSGVIGLQLGIVSTLVLTPLAYVYLKSGPTRQSPWQIEDVTPSRRILMELGQGVGDWVILLLMLFWLGVGGLVLCFFRLPLSEIYPAHLFFTLFLISAPAMAMVVGLKRLLSSRPGLREGPGDSIFIMLWFVGNIFAVSAMNSDRPLFYDIFGFASSTKLAMDGAISVLAIGPTPPTETLIAIDAVTGLWQTEFLLARAQWTLTGLGLCVLAALIYQSRQKLITKDMVLVPKSNLFVSQTLQGDFIARKVLGLFNFAPLIASTLSQLLRPGWVVAMLLVASISGVVAPFRNGTGAGVMLIMIFLISRLGVSWEGRNLRRLKGTMPIGLIRQAGTMWLVTGLFTFILFLPAVLDHAASGINILPEALLISTLLPSCGIGLGMLTRNATASRLVLLIMWYVYFNL